MNARFLPYVLMIAGCLLTPVVSGQGFWIRYEFMGGPNNPILCADLANMAGQGGEVYVAPGIESVINVFSTDPCEWACGGICPMGGGEGSHILKVSKDTIPSCMELSVRGGYCVSNTIDSFLVAVECDGWPAFGAIVTANKYGGAIKTSACGDYLPLNSSASVWYEPPMPGTNGVIPLPGPLVWSVSGNATIVSNGPSSATVYSGGTPGTITIRVASAAFPNCYVETTLQVGNEPSSCPGICSSSPGGNSGLFGNGSEIIASAPGSGFEMQLGRLIGGESAQSLRLALDLGKSLHSVSDLTFPWSFHNVITLQAVSNGPIQQIRVPEGLVTIDDSGTEFDVFFYQNENVGARGSNGFAVVGGYMVNWHFEVASNVVAIYEYRSGENTRASSFLRSSNGWTYTRPDSTKESLLYDSTTFIRTNRIVTASGATERLSVKEYTSYPFGERMTRETLGSGSDAHISTWDYYTNGLLKQVQRSDGYWEYYIYDDQWRPTNIFSAFGNQTLTNNKALCRLIEHSYDTNLVGTGDAGVYSPLSPRRTIEYVLGQPVALRYQKFVFGETREIRCLNTSAAWDAGDNLVTITRSFTNGFFYGEPMSIERPDGTMDFFEKTCGGFTPAFVPGALTLNWTNITYSGVPNTGKTAIIDGTKTVTIKGPLGQLISETTTDIKSSGIVIGRQLYGDYDVYIRPQAVTNLDGTWEFSRRFCCGDVVTTNREGTITTKTYDVMNRLLTSTTSGIMHSNVYDAAGKVLQVIRIGTDGSKITLQRNGYDTAGHLFATTNAVGDVTLFAEAVGAGGFTNTTTKLTNSSSGPQRIEARFLDGTVKSISGGLSHPMRYEYGPTNGGTFTKEIKLDANGGSNEWTTQFYDTAGRPYKTLYADGAFSQIFYNSKGQATNDIDPDGVSTIYDYNLKGERFLTVLDFDRDGSIDWTGPDRITRTTNYVTNNGSGDVQRTLAYAWSSNANVSALMAQNDAAVNGLTNWSTRFGLTTRTETKIPGGGLRFTITVAPDGSFITNRFEHNRLVSSIRSDGSSLLTRTTFEYDEHGRRKFVIDARNGTNVYSFDALDRVVVTRTPAPDASNPPQTNAFRFDALGRITAVTNADGAVLLKEYFDSGELRRTSGAREYPVEYAYDAQGRMTTMKTWQEFNGGSGTPTVTSWTNDTQRGWMIRKRYADDKGPDYAYTPAGRLYQRTWARGVMTTYTTNAAGEIAAIDYSDSTPDVTYAYDRLGRRTNIVDGAGTHILSYELDGRLLVETNTAGILASLAVTNGYDALNRRFALGLVSDANTVVNYGYDGASRLIGVTNGVNTANYSYVANSPLVSDIEFKQSGTTRMTTTKSYDYLNRLTLITNHLTGAGDESPAFAYAHNSANQRTAITNFGGTSSESPTKWLYTYDSLGQVTSGSKRWSDGSVVLGQQFEYTFDDIGNRKTTVSGGDAGGRLKRTQNYTANNLNQYTQRTVPGYLDIIGSATNTATVTVNHAATSRKGSYYRGEVPVANNAAAAWPRITNVATTAAGTNDYVTNAIGNLFVPNTPEVFGYDLDGNMTNDGRWAMTWDGENRLIQMESLPNGPIGCSNRLVFAYDQQSRRVSKAVQTFNGGAWSVTLSNRFVYDDWSLLAELNATNNTVINSFVWGLDLFGSIESEGGVGGLLFIASTNAGTHLTGYDGNGNVSVLVTANTGTAAAEYEYDPFGNVQRATGPMISLNVLRFSTKHVDTESGLYYYGHRFYNPFIGRWLSQDPIDDPGFNRAKALKSGMGNSQSQFITASRFVNLRHNDFSNWLKSFPTSSGTFASRSESYDSDENISEQVYRYVFNDNSPVDRIDRLGLIAAPPPIFFYYPCFNPCCNWWPTCKIYPPKPLGPKKPLQFIVCIQAAINALTANCTGCNYARFERSCEFATGCFNDFW